MRRKRIIRIGIQNTLPANYAQNQLEPTGMKRNMILIFKGNRAREKIKKITHVIVLWILCIILH